MGILFSNSLWRLGLAFFLSILVSTFANKAKIQVLDNFISRGDYNGLVQYVNNIEKNNPKQLLADRNVPYLLYRGLSYFNLQLSDKAEADFLRVVKAFPDFGRSWINLGEAQMLNLKFSESLQSFARAYDLNEPAALQRVVGSKGWCASWEKLEFYASRIAEATSICNKNREYCQLESAIGVEYAQIPGNLTKLLFSLPLQSAISKDLLNTPLRINEIRNGDRMRLGFISSDFNVHPVSSLIRGAIQMLSETNRYELFAYSIAPQVSWWGYNISEVVNFRFLNSMNSLDAARVVASDNVDILFDLNGHTKNSGLSVMSHRPAPIQISFLGLPTTTGASYIDYYLGDYVALPPEHRDHFTESLILMPPCYIVNDYAQTQGEIVTKYSGKNRAPRSEIETVEDVTNATIVFGTIANSQKLDPSTFTIWMNILSRFPGSKLVFHEHAGMDHVHSNLRNYSKAFGISPDRLGMAPLTPWIDHLYIKTAFDMFLDSVVKNGHTTSLDAVWAGVPLVSVGGGHWMSTRAVESIFESLGNQNGLAFSLKEYEDLVINYFTKGKNFQQKYRNELESLRDKSPLFNTKRWTTSLVHFLDATMEIETLRSRGHLTRPMHIFAYSRQEKVDNYWQKFPLHQIYDDQSKYFPTPFESNGDMDDDNSPDSLNHGDTGSRQRTLPKIEQLIDDNGNVDFKAAKRLPLPSKAIDGSSLVFLRFGGRDKEGAKDWIEVNSEYSWKGANSPIDIARDPWDLRGFRNGSVSAIYASHFLHKIPSEDLMLWRTVVELHRVLRPRGLIMVSVPDIAKLGRFFLREGASLAYKKAVMKLMYGSQKSKRDYNHFAFSFNVLSGFLAAAGFCDIEKLSRFNLFEDESLTVIHGQSVSLNIAAKKCGPESTLHDNFDIRHNGVLDPGDWNQL